MISWICFSYAAGEHPQQTIVTASMDSHEVGSVGMIEFRSWISIGQLYVKPAWRRQGVARRLMLHVLDLYPQWETWLFAEPYETAGGNPEGASREVLERFYASLGFELAADGEGKRAMVRWPVDCPAARPLLSAGNRDLPCSA